MLLDPGAGALQERVVRQLAGEGLSTPMTSGSSHSPGTRPRARIRSITSQRPSGKRTVEGCQAPTLLHQPPATPLSSYQPASMQKISAPAAAAASISGSSFAVVGSPSRVFM